MKQKVINSDIVISEDIKIIINGHNAFNYRLCDSSIEETILEVRKDFKKSIDKIFDSTTIIIEEDIQEFMEEAVNLYYSRAPIISCDSIYLNNNDKVFEYLDSSRLVNDGTLILRKTNQKIEYQILQIARRLLASGYKEIILVDDVLFSGETMDVIVSLFKEYGISTVGIISAISMEKGVIYFKEKGTYVYTKFIMSDKVIDEVCERDFYAGIPQSGISYRNENGIILKKPYFLPYGNPTERASIPEEFANDFSIGCLERSLILQEEIERTTGKNLTMGDLPEKIDGIEDNESIKENISKSLIRLRRNK